MRCVCALLLLVWSSSARPPNIIFILADDLGWAELGCYGNSFNETPHLDALAAAGLRFTHAYAAAPVCSPYRAALLTGQHPARIGLTDYLRPGDPPLSTQHITLPEMLKRGGYATGHIGKWHLTGYAHHGAKNETRPTEHGFDEEIAAEVKGVGNGANTWPYVFRDQPISWLKLDGPKLGPDEYLVDRMNLEAVDFIRRHRDRPFFLYLSHYAPHSIVHGKPALVTKYRAKHKPGPSSRSRCYLCTDEGLGPRDPDSHWASHHNPHLAAMIESIDDGVGMISQALAKLGLSNNSIVVFSSDNGGETNVTSNAPLRGGKSQLYEGGIRVPLIVRWPGQISPGTCTQPTVNTDFYPTFLSVAEIASDPAQHLDGRSILPLLRRPQTPQPARALHWYYPLNKPHFLGGRSSAAIRVPGWKLIEFWDDQSVELYSDDDPSELRNLAAKHPERVRELRAQLKAWQAETAAHPPGHN
jgi:arylsulfatase A